MVINGRKLTEIEHGTCVTIVAGSEMISFATQTKNMYEFYFARTQDYDGFF